MKQDDHLVTVLGEAPGATVRQIAQFVARTLKITGSDRNS